jgi:hypothetical protein
MLKVISKYEAKILIHEGDCNSLCMIVTLGLFILLTQVFVHYDPLTPPIAEFDAVVPHGSQVYSYYDLPDPKVKHQP